MSLNLSQEDIETEQLPVEYSPSMENEEGYYHFFENAALGIFQLDGNGKFILANSALVRILGYGSVREFLEQNIHIGIQLFKDSKHWLKIRKLLSTRQSVVKVQSQWRCKDLGDIAMHRKESVVQFVDEFQYLNSEIYRDEAMTQGIDDMASGYMRTAENKNAPLLVSGSWIGWLSRMLNRMTGRFKLNFLEALPREEAVEMVFKYSYLEQIPVSDASANLIAQMCEGNPSYISSLMRSDVPGKDLTTAQGVLETLEFETLDERGEIKNTWKEYLLSALPRMNAIHAKQILLYLCKRKEEQVLRRDLLNDLNLPMSEEELERKMEMLIGADIVERGRTHARYQAVQDNIFDKVFRGMYAEDIERFDPVEIRNEYKALFEDIQRKYRQLLGKYSQEKGAFAEYHILKKLRSAYRDPEQFRAMMQNLPEDFCFVNYESVWSYYGTAQGRPDFQVDIWARAAEGPSIIGEVKNRENAPFDATEAHNFLQKFATMQELEGITDALGFVYSRNGFSTPALDILREQQIAYSEDERWLD